MQTERTRAEDDDKDRDRKRPLRPWLVDVDLDELR
jgi:hypothetical protein